MSGPFRLRSLGRGRPLLLSLRRRLSCCGSLFRCLNPRLLLLGRRLRSPLLPLPPRLLLALRTRSLPLQPPRRLSQRVAPAARLLQQRRRAAG